MSKGRFEGLFAQQVEDRKDFVMKLIESGLWTQRWALNCALDKLGDKGIEEMLTYENIPLDTEFYSEPTEERHLVARHPNIKEGYTRGIDG